MSAQAKTQMRKRFIRAQEVSHLDTRLPCLGRSLRTLEIQVHRKMDVNHVQLAPKGSAGAAPKGCLSSSRRCLAAGFVEAPVRRRRHVPATRPEPLSWHVISGSDSLEETMPGLRKKVLLSGAGHWIQQERPMEVNDLLIQFLKSL
jgi:pimeloyl-ACP methyl ester carboxylesterase